MTPRDRAENYSKGFPNFPPLRYDDRWVDGVWVLGNDYRTKSKLYGAFPAGFLKRIYALFPEHAPEKTLHLFGGLVGQGLTVDLVLERRPRLVADCQALPFLDASISGLIISDPPYSVDDAERYNTPMPNRKKVISEAARIAQPGTQLVWLDTVLPMFKKTEWHWWGAIGIVRSTNHRVRLCSIFERK